MMMNIQKQQGPPPAPKKKPEPPKDYFRLRYLRFRFQDYISTIDFYRTLGMTVEFEVGQETTTVSTAPLAKGLKAVMKESGVEQPANGTQEPPTRVFGVSYVDNQAAPEAITSRVILLFEEDTEVLSNLTISLPKNDNYVKPTRDIKRQTRMEGSKTATIIMNIW
jgi:hypothetical protein